ncbi:MAG: tail fiber protein, partial [Cupriavidus sp.]|nr:tail fiber protein [Cupriavidus sp.]
MKQQQWAAALSVATSVLLASCGGGDGTGTAASNPAPLPAATISGTAATGAPIANAALMVKCVSGQTTVTTGSDGSWSASTANLALPCVLRVTTSTGEVLHSYIESAGTTNVTPITELVVSAAYGNADTEAFFTNFSTVSAAAASDKLALAITQVKQRLSTLGVNADSLNLLNQKFNPRNGDNYDDRLEEI